MKIPYFKEIKLPKKQIKNMRGYNTLRKKCLEILNSDLPSSLHYHSIRHTLNVLKNCEYHIRYYDIEPYDAKLLRLGVLLHDIGFTVTIEEHELESAKIALKLMTEYGFSKSEIEVVRGLIMATRLPQSPGNLLERIICDVDLDYLGRKDFYKISDLLYKELLERSAYFDKNHWNKIQIEFLENHTYHTEFAKRRRQKAKERRIEELKASITD